MLRGLMIAGLLAVVLVAAGCAVMPNGSIIAPVAVTQSPVAVGDLSVGTSKHGQSMCEGYLFVAVGDASIQAAMENGGITRIHHIDSEELNVLGIYARQIIHVYGE
jgi:hypothetical protein